MSPDVIIGGTLVIVGAPVLLVGMLVWLWQQGSNAARYTVTGRQVRQARRAAHSATLARHDVIVLPGTVEATFYRLDAHISRGAMADTAADITATYRTARETKRTGR